MAGHNDAQTGGFLQGLWDDTKEVFRDVVDFEKFKFQAELFNDRQKFEAQLAADQAPRTFRSFGSPEGQSNLVTFAIIGAAIAAGVWLLGRVT